MRARGAGWRRVQRNSKLAWVVGTSCGQEGIPLGALASWPGLVGDDSLQLVCGVIDSLTAASSAGPVVVGVDDPHLLDDLSMFVLDQVVQRGVAKVLLTLRDDELIPIAIQELWKLGEFERVDLDPLRKTRRRRCCRRCWTSRWSLRLLAACGS